MADPLDNWREEMQSAWLYQLMAKAEKGTSREKLFRDLASAAEKQAGIWLEAIGHKGSPPPFKPSFRARVASGLISRYGPRRIKTVLAALKVRGLSVYSSRGHRMPTAV